MDISTKSEVKVNFKYQPAFIGLAIVLVISIIVIILIKGNLYLSTMSVYVLVVFYLFLFLIIGYWNDKITNEFSKSIAIILWAIIPVVFTFLLVRANLDNSQNINIISSVFSGLMAIGAACIAANMQISSSKKAEAKKYELEVENVLEMINRFLENEIFENSCSFLEGPPQTRLITKEWQLVKYTLIRYLNGHKYTRFFSDILLLYSVIEDYNSKLDSNSDVDVSFKGILGRQFTIVEVELNKIFGNRE